VSKSTDANFPNGLLPRMRITVRLRSWAGVGSERETSNDQRDSVNKLGVSPQVDVTATSRD
jgi:hypothetical protein